MEERLLVARAKAWRTDPEYMARLEAGRPGAPPPPPTDPSEHAGDDAPG